jgi:hypothetical protein
MIAAMLRVRLGDQLLAGSMSSQIATGETAANSCCAATASLHPTA